jgi:hypothetical protein
VVPVLLHPSPIFGEGQGVGPSPLHNAPSFVTNQVMTPQAFIAKWRDVELKERSALQSHFKNLFRLVFRAITGNPKQIFARFSSCELKLMN